MSHGLYIHIPFCSFVCPYCDFAKTANWDEGLVADYFRALTKHFAHWHRRLDQPRFETVFFGGGTPGLFAQEYADLFAAFGPYLQPNAEVSIEANPNNLTQENLAAWRRLGFNRISVGVQSFHPEELAFLKRDHSSDDAKEGIVRACTIFDRVSCDLIYGLPGQNADRWASDLNTAVGLGVNHLSLYNLTYEARTPIGRAFHRGKIQGMDDEAEYGLYQQACHFLRANGFEHYEVSNWSRPGQRAVHNANYWQDRSFLGMGAGAHGYIADVNEGLRYAFGPNPRSFARSKDICTEIVDPRTIDDWLVEYVGASLRTSYGTDLERIAAKGFTFQPSTSIQRAIVEGQVELKGKRIYLSEAEWFRENYWCGEVLRSLPTSFKARS